MEEVLYTVFEASKLLKTNVNYVYELINKGFLPALKLGSLKIRRSSLLEFLKNNEGNDLSDLNNIKKLGEWLKMKIVNKKRFFLAIMILIILVITLFSHCSAIQKNNEIENITVSAGDTLWSISCEYKKDGQDVREYLYELRKLNNLENCRIYPGQVLKIIK